jgi:hypothetical protein
MISQDDRDIADLLGWQAEERYRARREADERRVVWHRPQRSELIAPDLGVGYLLVAGLCLGIFGLIYSGIRRRKS